MSGGTCAICVALGLLRGAIPESILSPRNRIARAVLGPGLGRALKRTRSTHLIEELLAVRQGAEGELKAPRIKQFAHSAEAREIPEELDETWKGSRELHDLE